jgi:putative tricarboxylic transport membrane protein
MKFNQALLGLLVILLGLAVVLQARTFPSMPGQSIGPAFFPTIIGVGLLLTGAALALSRRGRRPPWIEGAEWLRRPRMLFNFLLVFSDLVFYAVAVTRLGFFITAVLFLGVLMAAFGVPRGRVLPFALVVTFAIHYAFYSLLRVPLPWGVLERFAW